MGMVFTGAVLGMLLMGYLGDLVGRRRGLLITLTLTVLGALGCAAFPIGGSSDTVYAVITASRFSSLFFLL